MTSLASVRASLGRPSSRQPAPPWPLLLVAAAVAVLALLPLIYLTLRAIDGGTDALEALARPRTVELVVSTLALGGAVIIGSVSLGVPLAWLTVRTDLPARRAFSVLAIAPLAVPSYLLAFAFVGAFAPRGWLGGLGVTSVYGFWGAALVLSLATMPYVVIATRAALMRLDLSLIHISEPTRRATISRMPSSA